MAPEQAKGKQADKRSDIWSFGVILYEVLTGKRLFSGETAVETLGAVLNKEPDWTPVPERMRRLLQRCLKKDRKQRLGAMGDARWMMEEAPAGGRIINRASAISFGQARLDCGRHCRHHRSLYIFYCLSGNPPGAAEAAGAPGCRFRLQPVWRNQRCPRDPFARWHTSGVRIKRKTLHS